MTTIAAHLGISDMTLRAWLYAHRHQPAAERCELVVAESGTDGGDVERSHPITLTTADGPVVSGLDLQALAALLRALG